MNTPVRSIASRVAAGSIAAGAVIALVAGPTLAGTTPLPGTTYLPHRLAVLTNDRYNHDCFWGGPKGVDYENMPNVQPIQIPNQYPDVGSTYFNAQFLLPAGASLTLEGKYPYERYFSYTIWKALTSNAIALNAIGPGDHLRDVDIKPDPGSVNSFLPGAKRYTGSPRNYTLHVVSGPVPRVRARNTIYTGYTDPSIRIGMAMRNYLADKGKDGTGGVGLPKLTLNLADGQKLHGAAACAALHPIKTPTKSTFPAAVWKQLVASSSDPVNAPARNPVHWERFWNAAYSVAGQFVSNPVERAKMYPPTDTGGFQSNPDTRYLAAFISLKYSPVVTVTGKMPTFPTTLPASLSWPTRPYQLRYWSLCTGSSPVSGFGYGCVYDQEVPLRADRRYTIVISRPADRPRNATTACGYQWLTFGDGEDYPDPAARNWIDIVYMRFMAANPSWAQAPQQMKTPGTEAKVMGPYLPQSTYTTTKAFEKLGCHRSASSK
jgi:hypothetical protein